MLLTKNALLSGLALCLLLLTGQTQAYTLDFSCILSDDDPYTDDCQIAEDQLSVEITLVDNVTDPDQVILTIYNTGTEQMTVDAVYLDDGGVLFETPIAIEDLAYSNTGISFDVPAVPGELPGATNVGFESTIGLTTDADVPAPDLGINPGEWLEVTLDLLSTASLDDVVAAIASGDLVIGVTTINFVDGGSESLVTNPVPVPAAVWLFGSALLGLVGVARRKRA
jgi:hypothetical protein